MTKKKSTKRALISSLLILAMCFTMLAGTTFAWFSDSVVSTGNIIKSGKLDIEVSWANGTEDPDAAATTWTDASTGAIFDYDLWEPGYVQARHIKIENVGNLALKYQFAIRANGEVSKLADVIDVYYADPAVQVADRATLATQQPIGTLTEVLAAMDQTASGKLLPGAKDQVTIVLKMKENAGNEYQNLSIGSNFSVQVLATQAMEEIDSFDKTYDELADGTPDNAQFPVVAPGTIAEFDAAIANAQAGDIIDFGGENAILMANTTVDEPITIRNTVFDTSNSQANVNMYAVDFQDEVTFENCDFVGSEYGVYSNDFRDDVTFKDCTFDAANGFSAFYNNRAYGDVTFENCTMDAATYCVNFGRIDGTLTLRNCEITGWASFGSGTNSKVVIENCNFHRSTAGYNKLRFYQDAEVSNCTFDTTFFGATNDTYGSFAGGIDAATDGVEIRLNGNKVKNTDNNTIIDLNNGHIANCTGVTAVWYIDDVQVDPA